MRKKKNKGIYLAIFIIGLLVFSSFAFILDFSNREDFSHNGYEFSKQGNLWVTEADIGFGSKEYKFLYHPTEINLDIPDSNIIKLSPTIKIVFDPNISQIEYAEAARYELTSFLTEYGKNVDSYILVNSSQYNLPIGDCGQGLTIRFLEGESKVFNDNDCITVSTYSPEEYIQFSEKIMYSLLGII